MFTSQKSAGCGEVSERASELNCIWVQQEQPEASLSEMVPRCSSMRVRPENVKLKRKYDGWKLL